MLFMETIQIDKDVFAFLQSNAKPFIDTPNSTLRRLFKIDEIEVSAHNKNSTSSDFDELDDSLAESMAFRKKAPKADLKVLVNKGALLNGQNLYLVDYQGNKVDGISASITNNRLFYNNQSYSMSELAEALLKKIGFASNSVRGPAHWVTDDGKSIKDLWLLHLKES